MICGLAKARYAPAALDSDACTALLPDRTAARTALSILLVEDM